MQRHFPIGSRAHRLAALVILALGGIPHAQAQLVDILPQRQPMGSMRPAEAPGDGVVIEGRIKLPGIERPTGTGQFKFVLYQPDNRGGARQFWASDRGSVSGAVMEPTTSIDIPVRAGRYQVHLGDGVLTPPMPELDAPIRAAGTRYVRIWFRHPDRQFRAMEPDLPLDAAPLAREAALAGDADKLEGQGGAYYLDRANHTGAAPFVVFDGLPSWPFQGDYPAEARRRGSREWREVGCGLYRLAAVRLVAPSEGTVIVTGHSSASGVGRAGSGICRDTTQTLRLCVPVPASGPPPPPAGNAPSLPSVPDIPSPPEVSPPAVNTPALPPLGAGRGSRAGPPPTRDACLPGQIEVEQGGVGRENSRAGTITMWISRPDQPEGQRVQSVTQTVDFEPNVFGGIRVETSVTLKVPPGPVELELWVRLDMAIGIAERNLTALFIPTR